MPTPEPWLPAPSRSSELSPGSSRVCQEAGARVAGNMRFADMNLPAPVADARRTGLFAMACHHLAADITCVSSVTRSGEPRPGSNSQPGFALWLATQRQHHDTYPELSRCRLDAQEEKSATVLRALRARFCFITILFPLCHYSALSSDFRGRNWRLEAAGALNLPPSCGSLHTRTASALAAVCWVLRAVAWEGGHDRGIDGELGIMPGCNRPRFAARR